MPAEVQGGKRKQQEAEITATMKKLKDIDGKLSQVLVLTVNPQLSLSATIVETFKCSICLNSPLTPPVVVGKCCRRIIGCQACVEEWYRQGDQVESKRCPLCQSVNGQAQIMVMLGMDDFMEIVKNGLLEPSASPVEPHPTSLAPHVPPAPLHEELTDSESE